MNAIELSPSASVSTPRGWEDKEQQVTWQRVSVKLDHVFFVLFFLCAVISYCVIYISNVNWVFSKMMDTKLSWAYLGQVFIAG